VSSSPEHQEPAHSLWHIIAHLLQANPRLVAIATLEGSGDRSELAITYCPLPLPDGSLCRLVTAPGGRWAARQIVDTRMGRGKTSLKPHKSQEADLRLHRHSIWDRQHIYRPNTAHLAAKCNAEHDASNGPAQLCVVFDDK